MENCPRCKSQAIRKDGIVQNRQRYLCKECRYRFTVAHIGKPAELKEAALGLYLEGLGFRSIGRLLKVSHVSVYNWIRDFGARAGQLQSAESIDVVEMDEMHTYVASKKNMHGYGLPLTGTTKALSTPKSAQEAPKQEKSSGKI